jgi:hypothetical protein
VLEMQPQQRVDRHRRAPQPRIEHTPPRRDESAATRHPIFQGQVARRAAGGRQVGIPRRTGRCGTKRVDPDLHVRVAAPPWAIGRVRCRGTATARFANAGSAMPSPIRAGVAASVRTLAPARRSRQPWSGSGARAVSLGGDPRRVCPGRRVLNWARGGVERTIIFWIIDSPAGGRL